MGCNVEWIQGIQEDLVQSRAPLSQESAVAQALQGKESMLADIIEEEIAHRMQISVLSQLHFRQAEEIQVQSHEIQHLSTLLENLQAILPDKGPGKAESFF